MAINQQHPDINLNNFIFNFEEKYNGIEKILT